MALSYTANPPQLVGTRRRVTGTITFDSSYLTGGEIFDQTKIGLTTLESLIVRSGLGSSTTAYMPVWSATTPTKIQVFQGDNTNAAAAPLIECNTTRDLSAFICTYEATGF